MIANARAMKVANPSFDEKRQRARELQQSLIDQAQQAQEELDELDREEQAEQYAYLQQLRVRREGHLADAAGFREMAKMETDQAEKENLFRLALAETEKANAIALELGISPDDQAEVKPKIPFLKRPIVAIAQVAGILLLISWAYKAFNQFHDYIQTLNQNLAPERQLQPYDLTSMQKFFYEKMVIFSDLPVALLIVFAIVPFVGFYVLPFFRSKRDFYTEFTEDLTAWQRSLLTTIIFLGVLFYLALSHTVKP